MVIGLTVFHIMLGKWRKDFEANRNQRPERFFRLINEVPTVLMVIIVVSGYSETVLTLFLKTCLSAFILSICPAIEQKKLSIPLSSS